MEEKTPSSLQHMLQKSLTTFQRGMASDDADMAYTARVPNLCPDENERTRQALLARLVKVVEAHAPDGAALLDTALAADAAGKREAALLLYDLSLAVAPSAKAYNNIAVLYAEVDDEDLALEWLERGLEQFPLDATLRENYDTLSQS